MTKKTLLLLSTALLLSLQGAWAMEKDDTCMEGLKEGYYTIKNRYFSNNYKDPKHSDDKEPKRREQHGLLAIADGNTRSEEAYFGKNESSPSGQHAQILADKFDYNNYLSGASKREQAIWYIKPQDNAYTIQNVAYKSKNSFSGLLSCSDSKSSPSGSYVQVLKEGSYENWKDQYLFGGANRENILWDFVKAEDSTYKIQSLSLKKPERGSYNQGWLDSVKHQSSNGYYVQALHFSEHPEYYFIDKDTGERGRWRDGLLWELSPLSQEEIDSIVKKYSEIESK